MSRQKKEENRESEELSSNDISKNLLGSLLNGYKEDHYVNVESLSRVVSTGSLLLDSLIKVRSGSVVRLVGRGAELGKTSESFVLADNYMKVMEKSKAIYVKAEGRLSQEMIERSGLRFVFKAEDWDYGTVFVFPCNIFETVAQILEALLKQMHEKGEHLCAIIDSLDGLTLKTDLAKEVFSNKSGENVKVAGVPLMTKLLFRRIALPIAHYDALLLITGQYSADIKLDPYSPNIPRQVESAGGSSIAHQSDVVLSYMPRYPSDYILTNEDDKPHVIKNPIIGVYATIEIKKSGTEETGTKIRVPIKKGVKGCQIWRAKEVTDMLFYWELAKREKAWVYFGDTLLKQAKEAGIELKEKIQGLNNLYQYLENDKTVCDWLYKKFSDLNESLSA